MSDGNGSHINQAATVDYSLVPLYLAINPESLATFSHPDSYYA